MTTPITDVSRRERYAIRRAAIADARNRMPLPSMDGVVSTPYREALWTDRDERITVLHADLSEVAAQAASRIAAMQADMVLHEHRLTRAHESLRLTRAQEVDVNERLVGDEGVPDALVATRRRREHARAVRALEKSCAEQERLLADLRARCGQEQAALLRRRRACAAEAAIVHHGTLARCALYDSTLLRKHPQRQLVAYCLDDEPRPLPRWVTVAAEEDEPDGEPAPVTDDTPVEQPIDNGQES